MGHDQKEKFLGSPQYAGSVWARAHRRNAHGGSDPSVREVVPLKRAAPLALSQPSAPPATSFAPFFRPGQRTAVKTSSGCAAAIFEFEQYDPHLKTAAYSLKILNESAVTLTCWIWGISTSGEVALAYPLAVYVAPFAVKSRTILVRLDAFKSLGRTIAEISGDGVYMTVEAPAPQRKESRAMPVIATAGFATAAAVALGSVLISSLPHISAFAAPPMALNGTTVEAEYAASGRGQLSYIIQSPDGKQLQGGALRTRSGTISIALPPSGQAGAYTMRLSMQGPLGSDKAFRVLNAVPRKTITLTGADIAGITVTPMVAKPGQMVRVAYTATGDAGYVRLQSADGAIWGQQRFSHLGSAYFQIPAIGGTKEMRVVVHVTRGGSTAESSAGLIVAAAGPATLAAAPAPLSQNGTFQVETLAVPSGGTIRVRITAPRNGLRLSLTDTQSREISSVAVGLNQRVVLLRAPDVQLAAPYVVVANFSDGFGQETAVQPVTVSP